ncbi:hypothetical protein [Flavobacterium psychraquaticum]|uniref:hypothetical protein n=1 Tax=Flavobacterium psychraquaticum TaxID=3103958 RepID=UPI002ACE2B5D|nr:hypothetical protein [Flavobacterium sp. LB-N7T]
MKNSLKLFGVLVFSLSVFSCSTDEQDADLERALNLSESSYQREGVDSTNIADSTTVVTHKEDSNPVTVSKKD